MRQWSPSRRWITPGLIAFSSAAAAAASAGPGDTEVLVTLDEAVAYAPHLAEVRAAGAAQKIAAAATRAAGRPGDLGVSFATHSVSARESVTATLSLPWLGQRRARQNVARESEGVAGAETRLALADARRDLRGAWLVLRVAEERRRIAAEQHARALQNARAVTDLYEAGRVPRLDSKRAEAEAAISGAADAGAEHERHGAAAALAFLMDQDAEARSAGPSPPVMTEVSLDALAAGARAEAVELRIAIAQLRAADAGVVLAERARRPGLGLELGADFDDPTQPGIDKRVGLTFTVPLAGGPASAAARAERERRQMLVELERRRAVAGAVAAWTAGRAAQARYEALDREAFPAAQEAAELGRLSYREGRSDLLRLLEVERTLAQVELDRLDAYRAWALADADLRRILGESQP